MDKTSTEPSWTAQIKAYVQQSMPFFALTIYVRIFKCFKTSFKTVMENILRMGGFYWKIPIVF